MTPAETITAPETVHAATRAFGTELRVELIRFFLAHPGPQAAAVIALAESSANISRNVQVLIEAGVIVVGTSDHGTKCYTVDAARVTSMAGAVVAHILGA